MHPIEGCLSSVQDSLGFLCYRHLIHCLHEGHHLVIIIILLVIIGVTNENILLQWNVFILLFINFHYIVYITSKYLAT